MKVLASGQTGRLMAGPYEAARLGAWTFSLLDEAMASGKWQVTAVMSAADRFWLDHWLEFKVTLDLGRQHWDWSQCQIEAGLRNVTITGEGRPRVRVENGT